MAIVRVPVRIEYPMPGGPGFNVWHLSTQPGGQAGDLGEALDALEAFYTKVRALIMPGTNIIIGEGMINDPLGDPTYVNDDSRTVTGGGTIAGVPAMVALVVGWRTASATRSGRGRTFLGPISQAALQTDGTPSTLRLGEVRSAAEELVADSQSANGWAIGVLSAKQGVWRETTGVSVRDRWAVLTSRRD